MTVRLPWVIWVPDLARASAYTPGACFAAAATSTSPQGSARTCLPDSADWNRASHDVATRVASSWLAGVLGASVPSEPPSDGDAPSVGWPSSSPAGCCTSTRAGLPWLSLLTASGTAGSTSQVSGREPAATPKSRTEESWPPSSTVSSQASSSATRPSASWRTWCRIGTTSAVSMGLPRPSGGSYGRKVRARPSATMSRPEALVPRACTPNQ